MLKKIGIPVMALMAILAAAPSPAAARVRFGVAIGGPVYTAPVPVAPYVAPYPAPYPYPYSAPAYVAPYGYADPYYATPYVAPGPYIAPSIGFGFGGGGYRRGYSGRGYVGPVRGGFRGRR